MAKQRSKQQSTKMEGETVRMPKDWWREVEEAGRASDRKRTSMARHLIRLALDARLHEKARYKLDVPAPGEGRR